MKRLLNFTRSLVALLAIPTALVFFYQHRLLYPAPPIALPINLPPHVERIDLGESYALLLESHAGEAHRKPLIIYAHGNGEAAVQWVDEFDGVLSRGISVLLVEYPGYAGASGSPTLGSIRETWLAAYDALTKRPGIDVKAIIVYGRSMGGGAAALLAAERPVAALVLESTFTTLARLVSEKGIPSFLLRDRYDIEATVRSLDVPVFVYHGTQDRLIPSSHGRALATAAKDSTFVTATCGHNSCPRPWDDLFVFLAEKAGIATGLP